MSNDVILHTPRMILRPFTVQDTCDVYAYARDPRVGPIAGWPAHQSYFESWDIVRTVFSQSGVFAMELRENHKVIGSIGFVGGHPAGELPDCPDDEIGYALSAAFWGRGLVPEALEAVLRYGFTERNLRSPDPESNMEEAVERYLGGTAEGEFLVIFGKEACSSCDYRPVCRRRFFIQ